MTLVLALVLVGAFTPMPQPSTSASPVDGESARFGVVAGAPFVVDLKLATYGRFRRDGSAVVFGSISCSRRSDFAWVAVMLRQRAGRGYVNGVGFGELVPCRKRATDLRIVVDERDGVFRGGSVQLEAFVVACRRHHCTEDGTSRVIRLKGRKR